MSSSRWRAALFVAVVGCGGGGAATGGPTGPAIGNTAGDGATGVAASEASCDPAIPALVARLFGDQVEPGQRDQIAEALVRRCEDDDWSADVVGCLDAATEESDAATCGDLLTPAQLEALETTLGAEFGASLDDLARSP